MVDKSTWNFWHKDVAGAFYFISNSMLLSDYYPYHCLHDKQTSLTGWQISRWNITELCFELQRKPKFFSKQFAKSYESGWLNIKHVVLFNASHIYMYLSFQYWYTHTAKLRTYFPLWCWFYKPRTRISRSIKKPQINIIQVLCWCC